MIKANVTIDINKKSVTEITGWNNESAAAKLFVEDVKAFIKENSDYRTSPNINMFSYGETLIVNTYNAETTRLWVAHLHVDTPAIATVHNTNLVKVHEI